MLFDALSLSGILPFSFQLLSFRSAVTPSRAPFLAHAGFQSMGCSRSGRTSEGCEDVFMLQNNQ